MSQAARSSAATTSYPARGSAVTSAWPRVPFAPNTIALTRTSSSGGGRAAGQRGTNVLFVGAHHHLHQLLEGDLGLPAQRLARLGGVAVQVVDLGGAEVALVDLDVLLP